MDLICFKSLLLNTILEKYHIKYTLFFQLNCARELPLIKELSVDIMLKIPVITHVIFTETG